MELTRIESVKRTGKIWWKSNNCKSATLVFFVEAKWNDRGHPGLIVGKIQEKKAHQKFASWQIWVICVKSIRNILSSLYLCISIFAIWIVGYFDSFFPVKFT